MKIRSISVAVVVVVGGLLTQRTTSNADAEKVTNTDPSEQVTFFDDFVESENLESPNIDGEAPKEYAAFSNVDSSVITLTKKLEAEQNIPWYISLAFYKKSVQANPDATSSFATRTREIISNIDANGKHDSLFDALKQATLELNLGENFHFDLLLLAEELNAQAVSEKRQDLNTFSASTELPKIDGKYVAPNIADDVLVVKKEAAAQGENIQVRSSWRSAAEQNLIRRLSCHLVPGQKEENIKKIYQTQAGNCDAPVAIPGKSNHESTGINGGGAVDFKCEGYKRFANSPCEKILRNTEGFSLKVNPSEPWHFSETGL